MSFGILTTKVGTPESLSAYHPCIHCFYYACLQRMLYIIAEHIPENEQIKKDSLIWEATHKIAEKNILNYLSKNDKDKGNWTIFKSSFIALKELRRKADYEPDLSTYNQSLKAKKFVDDVFLIFEEKFNITL